MNCFHVIGSPTYMGKWLVGYYELIPFFLPTFHTLISCVLISTPSESEKFCVVDSSRLLVFCFYYYLPRLWRDLMTCDSEVGCPVLQLTTVSLSLIVFNNVIVDHNFSICHSKRYPLALYDWRILLYVPICFCELVYHPVQFMVRQGVPGSPRLAFGIACLQVPIPRRATGWTMKDGASFSTVVIEPPPIHTGSAVLYLAWSLTQTVFMNAAHYRRYWKNCAGWWALISSPWSPTQTVNYHRHW